MIDNSCIDNARINFSKKSFASRLVPITSSAWFSLVADSFEPLPEFIFVEKDSDFEFAFLNENLVAHESLTSTLLPLLNTEYVLENEGPMLAVFQRK